MRLAEFEIAAMRTSFQREVLEVLWRPRCGQMRLGIFFDYMRMPRILVKITAGQRLIGRLSMIILEFPSVS